MKILNIAVCLLLAGHCFSQPLSNPGSTDTTKFNLLDLLKYGFYIEPGITFISYDSKNVVDLSNLNNVAPAAYLNTDWLNYAFGSSKQHGLSFGAGLMYTRGTSHDDTSSIAKELLLPSNLSISLFSNYRFSFDAEKKYNLYAYFIGGLLKNTAIELSNSDNKFTVSSTSYAFGFGVEIKKYAAMLLYRNADSKESKRLQDLLGVTDLRRQSLSLALQIPLIRLNSFLILDLRQYIGGQMKDKFGSSSVIAITINTPIRLFDSPGKTGGFLHEDKVPHRSL